MSPVLLAIITSASTGAFAAATYVGLTAIEDRFGKRAMIVCAIATLAAGLLWLWKGGA